MTKSELTTRTAELKSARAAYNALFNEPFDIDAHQCSFADAKEHAGLDLQAAEHWFLETAGATPRNRLTAEQRQILDTLEFESDQLMAACWQAGRKA